MPSLRQPALVRAVGRWSLVALVVNCIVGSGIFGLPSVVASLLGSASLMAVPLAGAAIAVIIACFAEVASQFTQTGGTYLYIRAAFGTCAGIQVGWFNLLGRLTAAAAGANLFVTYLGALWPSATLAIPRFLILTLLVGILATVNYRGVRAATKVSNVFVVAKLSALGVVCMLGAFYLIAHHRVIPPPTAPASGGNWLKAVLVLFFAYGGFEAALTPMREAKDPRRDSAFALFVALITVGIIYVLIQWVVVGVLPDPAHSDRPLADAMRILVGPGGAILIAIAALISVCGYLSAIVLTGPRITFALAERGDFPLLFASVHPKFRTPHISVLVFAALVWALALSGNFAWNVTLSAAARLFYYGMTCGALPLLRRKQPAAASFRVPGGPVLAVLGVGICVVLMTAVDFSKILILAATSFVALVNWLLIRRMGSASVALDSLESEEPS